MRKYQLAFVTALYVPGTVLVLNSIISVKWAVRYESGAERRLDWKYKLGVISVLYLKPWGQIHQTRRKKREDLVQKREELVQGQSPNQRTLNLFCLDSG